MNEFFENKLENEIRLIFKPYKSRISHLCIFINSGTREENENEHGIAHFIEHSVFKGTPKRNLLKIINCLGNVGGELNAYTSKEETVIYASFLNNYFEKALELISDLVFNATFPQNEIDKEKDVIIEEINSYRDNPAELIFDEFENLIFKNHSLGNFILGNKKSIKKFKTNDLKNFVNRTYNTDEIVVGLVGDISEKKLLRIFDKYLSKYSANHRSFKRIIFENYHPFIKKQNKNIYQSHCLIGNIAYSYNNPKKNTLFLLNNILGGPFLNSRLNIALREKSGLTYNIESQYTPFSDTGIINVYFGTENNNLDKSIDIFNSEIKKLREKALTNNQLSIAKKQLLGLIALNQENQINELFSITKSYMAFNKVDSFEEIYRKIMKISSVDILEVANEIFAEDKLSYLIYNSK
jgi:predicted Zn-dependent peptidase